jgi:hypothetical protein
MAQPKKQTKATKQSKPEHTRNFGLECRRIAFIIGAVILLVLLILIVLSIWKSQNSNTSAQVDLTSGYHLYHTSEETEYLLTLQTLRREENVEILNISVAYAHFPHFYVTYEVT